MTTSKFCVLFTLFLLITAASAQRRMYPPWPPKDQAPQWEVNIGDDNELYMKRHYPYGTVDRWLTIFPGNGNGSSSPKHGTCRYPNGFTREMRKGELKYFWEVAGAKQALEAYIQTGGK